jgi:predicted alpha/beta superfamily hydrolase
VVAIGYPDCGNFVFGNRRSYDLTPPTETYDPPRSWDGSTFNAPHGGADDFLQFIQGPVREHLFSRILPSVVAEREILVGHSFGGLCTLHALFSQQSCFGTFIAISPSIWWNQCYLIQEEQEFLNRKATTPDQGKPSLYLSYGHYEQYPHRRRIYSDDEYAKRCDHALAWRTKDNADEMASRLDKSGHFFMVKVKEYADEDHGSVAGCALGWAVCDVLDPDRFD